jgi:hypothetical protein
MIDYEKRMNGKLLARFHAQERYVEQIDSLLKAVCRLAETHGNSRAVIIWGEIDEETYRKHREEFGGQEITEHSFPSARAASRHLGYTWDAVSQALQRAAERGEDIASVAGVPFRWADKIAGND